MSEVPSVSSRLSHRKVMGAAMASRGRRRLSSYWLYLLFFIAIAIAVWQGYIAAFLLAQRLSFDWMFAIGTWLPILMPALLGMALCILALALYEGLSQRRYLRSMRDAGVPMDRDVVYEIHPEGLKLVSDRIVIFPMWDAIDFVEKIGDDWVLQAEQLTFLIPGDSFADEAAEREFLTALAGHLSAETLSRSDDISPFTVSTAP